MYKTKPVEKWWSVVNLFEFFSLGLIKFIYYKKSESFEHAELNKAKAIKPIKPIKHIKTSF